MILEKIKSIEFIGKKHTYDINTLINHNFILSNGILTHNTGSKTEEYETHDIIDQVRAYKINFILIQVPDDTDQDWHYRIESLRWFDKEVGLSKNLIYFKQNKNPSGCIVLPQPPEWFRNEYESHKFINIEKTLSGKAIDRTKAWYVAAEKLIKTPQWNSPDNTKQMKRILLETAYGNKFPGKVREYIWTIAIDLERKRNEEMNKIDEVNVETYEKKSLHHVELPTVKYRPEKPLTPKEEKVLEILRANPNILQWQVCLDAKISQSTASRIIVNLKNRGLIE